MVEHNEIIATVPEQPVGWIETKLPEFVMTRLQSYIETAKNNPVSHNDKLVIIISKSLTLEDKDNWFFKIVLNSLIGKFMQCYPLYTDRVNLLTKAVPYCLGPLWVNFQKENECNPLHDHTGVFSFVVFVKIPTDWREQHALPICANSNLPKASNFEFQYTTMLGQINYYSYFLDKESEGKILFFPSKLMHMVHPFYNCDKERITISGNILFNISNDKN